MLYRIQLFFVFLFQQTTKSKWGWICESSINLNKGFQLRRVRYLCFCLQKLILLHCNSLKLTPFSKFFGIRRLRIIEFSFRLKYFGRYNNILAFWLGVGNTSKELFMIRNYNKTSIVRWKRPASPAKCPKLWGIKAKTFQVKKRLRLL